MQTPNLVMRCIRRPLEVGRRGVPSVMSLRYCTLRDEGGIGNLRGRNLMSLKCGGYGKGRDWKEAFIRTASAAAATVCGLWWASYDGGGMHDRHGQVESCGIIGIVGKDTSARETLLEGLTILLNRGYDSCGMATIDQDQNIVVSKFASRCNAADSIDLLKSNSSCHDYHTVGIAHTRWATHGGKTDQNAHPHMDYNNRIALVHNGTINNALELRAELQAKGIEFRSETDTECIAHLVGMELDLEPDITLLEATKRALSKVDGTYGLAIVAKDSPSNIVAACQGSPMVIGIAPDKIFVSSETSAFSRYTKNFISMKDGEIACLNAENFKVDSSRIEQAKHENVEFDPSPHPHWTIKECLQQPEAIARALAFGARFSDDRVRLGGMDRNVETLRGIANLIIAGCGTSYYASLYGAKLMRDVKALDSVVAMDAAEISSTDMPQREPGLLLLSQSGETRDVLKTAKLADSKGIPCMSVVNVVGSAIARQTGLGIYIHAGREQAVASTKSFTSQVTVLALLAIWFRQLRDEKLANQGLSEQYRNPNTKGLLMALQRLPISFGMAQQCRPLCKEVAKRIQDKKHCFILGKGNAYPIALEGALKLKLKESNPGWRLLVTIMHWAKQVISLSTTSQEIAYVHAEGYNGSALKHGPFALIEEKTPIILLILDDEHASQMRTAAEEVKARGAELFVITDNRKLADGLDPNPIVIPSNGELTSLIGVLPLQLIAYELAVLKGINPDTPRNLAKTLTTD